jgi:hypothetical protein
MKSIISQIQQDLNSWYLKTGEYHHFICKCGRVDQYTLGLPHIGRHPKHCCKACGNDYFVDSEIFLHNPKIRIYREIYCERVFDCDAGGWDVTYYLKIPYFCISSQTIRLKRIEVCYIEIYDSGCAKFEVVEHGILKRMVYNGHSRPQKLLDLLKKEAYTELVRLVEQNPIEKIVWLLHDKEYQSLTRSKEKLDVLNYFLRCGVKDFNYRYWYKPARVTLLHEDDFWKVGEPESIFDSESVVQILDNVCNQRTEKSIKRACFMAYEKAIRQKMYDPLPDILFSRTIKDPNLLVRLIQLDPEVKHKMFVDLPVNYVSNLLGLLMRHYDPKSLVHIFEQMQPETLHLFRDTCMILARDFDEGGGVIWRRFRRVSANIETIHNTFVEIWQRSRRYENEKTKFDYTAHQKKAEVKLHDNMVMRLPKTVGELDAWAHKLRNCMFSYVNDIIDKDSVIYGVEKQGKLKYAVEIRGGKLVQMKGRFNEEVEPIDKKLIQWWGRRYYNSGS